MSKVLVIPNGVTECELLNSEVEVLVLHENVKRLDIVYAPSLEKIICLSPSIILGPAEPKAEAPVLNHCVNLNEIITFGDIKVNTRIEVGGKVVEAAWTGINGDVPPTITSVGDEYTGDFPCFYYDLNAPIEEVYARLIDAEPQIRFCPAESFERLASIAIECPYQVTKPKFQQKEFGTQF